MGDGIGLIVGVIFTGICLIALLIGIDALFPRIVTRTQDASDETPGRAFIIGAVNFLFFGSVALGFAAISDSSGASFFLLPALILISLLSIGTVFGLASVAGMVGERLSPERNRYQQVLRGGVVLSLGALTPFIGWFGLLPYLVILGLGGFILSWFRGRGRLNRVDSPDQLSDQ